MVLELLDHRHLEKIDRLMACTARLVFGLVLLVAAAKMPLEEAVSLTLVTFFFETSKPQANIYYALVGLECQA